MQEQFEARRSMLAEMVRQRKRSQVQADIVKLENTLSVMREQQKALQADVEEKQKDAANFGSSSVNVDMMRSDLRTWRRCWPASPRRKKN